jgi:hypothetical protein
VRRRWSLVTGCEHDDNRVVRANALLDINHAAIDNDWTVTPAGWTTEYRKKTLEGVQVIGVTYTPEYAVQSATLNSDSFIGGELRERIVDCLEHL